MPPGLVFPGAHVPPGTLLLGLPVLPGPPVLPGVLVAPGVLLPPSGEPSFPQGSSVPFWFPEVQGVPLWGSFVGFTVPQSMETFKSTTRCQCQIERAYRPPCIPRRTRC